MEKNINDYTSCQMDIIKKAGLFKLYACPLIFLIIEVLVCIILHFYTMMVCLITINIVIFIIVMDSIISGMKEERAFLCGALVFSDMFLVFLVLSYLILSSVGKVSFLYIVLGIILYLVIAIINILNVLKRMKSDNGFRNVKYKKISGALGMMGGLIGVLIAKTLVSVMKYESLVFLVAIISLIISLICAFGSHLYLCYYWVKKYKKIQ